MKIKIVPFLFIILTLILSTNIDAQNDKTPSSVLQQAPIEKTDAPPQIPIPEAQDEIFKVVEQMPRFPGCEDQNLTGRTLELCAKKKLIAYIQNNLVYPEGARKNGIEGRVLIQFIVGKDGSLLEPRIVRDIVSEDCNNCEETCGQAALKMIKKMQSELKWVAGKQRGKPVKVQYTMPVIFKL